MIYFIQWEEGGPIKIGTTTNLHTRLREHGFGTDENFRVLGVREGGPRYERALHFKFATHRVGRRELFEPVAEILRFIETHTRPWDWYCPPQTPEDHETSIIWNGRYVAWARAFAKREGIDICALSDRAMKSYAAKRRFVPPPEDEPVLVQKRYMNELHPMPLFDKVTPPPER